LTIKSHNKGYGVLSGLQIFTVT